MIDIRGLTHIYPKQRKTPARMAIRDLSLAIEAGRFCILSGPNGSGKSSLFRILCGMSVPSAGTVLVGGHDIVADPARARAQMAVVFQSPAVDKYLSVAENLAIHGCLHGLSGPDYLKRRDESLAWTGLKERLDDRVDTLSGGLARQVELAKALLTRPSLLLLDEPTTGLDPAARRAFVTRLGDLKRERGMTILMTSHLFSEAEDADKVAIMKDGILLAYDAPEALRNSLGREMVVVQSPAAERLEARIRAETGLHTRRHGDEIRLPETGNGASLPILETLVERYRADIDAIAIKRPGLDDVFVHLTGPDAGAGSLLETA